MLAMEVGRNEIVVGPRKVEKKMTAISKWSSFGSLGHLHMYTVPDYVIMYTTDFLF